MYLNRDIIGPYSGIFYGAAGTPVTVISIQDDMAIVKSDSLPFPVRSEFLSEVQTVKPRPIPASDNHEEHKKSASSKKVKSKSR